MDTGSESIGHRETTEGIVGTLRIPGLNLSGMREEEGAARRKRKGKGRS